MIRALTLSFCLLSVSAGLVRADAENRTRVIGNSPTSDSAPSRHLDRKRLDEAGSQDLPALLAREPGLYVPRLGGLGSYATVSMRGSTPEQVLITLDGIPLNLADGSPVDLATLPLGPLQQVEIYQGRTPWSIGQVGLGGGIALSSGASRSFTSEGSLGFGSHGLVGLRAYAGARPFSLSVDYLSNANTFTYPHDNGTAWDSSDDTLETRQNAQSRHVNVLARSAHHLGPLHLHAVYLATSGSRGLTNLVAREDIGATLELTRHLGAIQARYRLSETWQLTGRAHVNWSSSEVQDPELHLPLPRERAPQHSLTPGALVSVEGQLWHKRIRPIFHLSARHEALSGALAMHRTLGSLAAEVQFRATHALWLASGLRAELGEAREDIAAFVSARHEGSAHRIGLQLHHTPRRPSLFERLGDFGLTLGNPDLRPETLTAVELDALVRHQVGELFGEFELNLYARQAHDLIAFLPNAQGISQPENLAHARLLGLDLSINLEWSEWLTLRSTLSWLDARDQSTIAARKGKKLPMRPALQSNNRLELRYLVPELRHRQTSLGLALEVDLLSDNYLDPANLVRIPTRTIVSTHAFFRQDNLELRVSLLNAGDSHIQDLAGYPLPGRSAFVWLKVTP